MSKFIDKISGDTLYRAVLTLKNEDESRRFFQDLCTVSELKAMEQRMEEVLGKIDGVGKLRLMLTLQSGTRLTLAEDTQRDQDRTQRETVTLNRGSGNQEIVITNRFYPVYQGAVVVCQGADSSAVRLAITETVQALTGLPSDRIRVAKWTS